MEVFQHCGVKVTKGVELQVSVHVAGFEIGKTDGIAEGLIDGLPAVDDVVTFNSYSKADNIQ